ncbi:MAG: VOC family protein [Ktedonobacterales bacterium]|nr:VOC family protein [Ktedonobacterales bacterium]
MSTPQSTPQQPASATTIAPATRVGLVALTVADLDRAVTFYTDALGFGALARDEATATLGVAGTPLLLLSARPGAQPARALATGLYHFAILVPSRVDLARTLRHWLELGYPMPGQADHLVSEALYLSDPDGNGIEIYQDRPRETWAWGQGQVRMAADPLDVPGLLAEADQREVPWTGLPTGTRIGHIHLQVSDLAQAEAFYHGVLGFAITARMPGALFLSAGGYHHHLGLNTWRSRGAGPAPAGTAGLRFFTLELPDEGARAAVLARLAAAGFATTAAGEASAIRDSDGITLLSHVGPVPDAQRAAALWGAAAG